VADDVYGQKDKMSYINREIGYW